MPRHHGLIIDLSGFAEQLLREKGFGDFLNGGAKATAVSATLNRQK